MNGQHGSSRAARLELRGRLDLARHATELLQLKEEALRRERVRLEGHALRTAQQWSERCERAGTWLARSRALGAGNELAALADRHTPLATIDTHWRDSMGVAYPGEVVVNHPATPSFTTTAALAPTAEAYRHALEAGAHQAAASAALQRVTAELMATRRRRRAIEHRLLPLLEERVSVLELRLDEDDRAQALRSRLAIRSRSGP